MTENPRRHCWECLRRCLVCDSTRPACNRCAATGYPCPGYGDVKPTRLVWLAPGKVKSRTRRRKEATTVSAKPNEPRDYRQPSDSDPQTSTPALFDPSDAILRIFLSRFGVYTDADALVHGAEYCNFHTLHAMLTRPEQSMVVFTKTYVLSSNSGTIQPYIAYRLPLFANRFRSQTTYAMECFLQQGASLNWRPHADGAIKLVQLRGGFASMATCKTLGPQLLILFFVAVIGNTTCPASDLSMTQAHLAALDVVQQLSRTAAVPFQMCPAPLFAEIIKINHLRHRAAKYASRGLVLPREMAQEALETLERVRAFSPDHWASTKPRSRPDWALIGHIYHAAVALYWASSLQSLSVLQAAAPPPPLCATAQARLLRGLLVRALACPHLRHFILWPLVVLGVQAAGEGGAAARDFVAAELPSLARSGGTRAPLTAKRVLERFWALGETRWDACFDRPYAFVMQIAADTSRIVSGGGGGCS
ncbi:hypothetical protein MYCTH_2065658 [Thermothelomyces thermophilus ATCC 42464]|uniref:Zn(2)-C6 fungal-type domain-containing protein n=1 Tax=Thermothelomyces thermophilus (strain ATCC 42464 / BCRC 31852 / DSM 1799) TaxID=573729 RepID=G2QGQ5_THET4|nr:uncharacterized protein MYCTH_2065658 [Thermothelomyces thermophilus ATCC 42464]AEO58617.1 hypothetical protein MYCTH_2065658 [Thermothelomyces thermophilus ATCC 42464]